MREIICQTVNLSKSYKNTKILDNINFQVKKGEIYGLIGENGAGKTTLMKILTGLAKASRGKIIMFNKENSDKERKRIGAIIESPALYLEMTAKQNLEFQRIQKGIPNKKCIENILNVVNLENLENKKVKNFSLGMKQRLGLAISLLGEPEILILDEPVNGLDPTGIKEFRELLIKLNKEKNITIIISSHILSELHKVATSYGIIHEGQLIEQISASELNEKCKKHIFIKVKKIKEAISLLERVLDVKKIVVYPNNVLKIYEKLDKCEEINKVLATNNIFLEEITIKGDSLESYFAKAIKGENNVQSY